MYIFRVSNVETRLNDKIPIFLTNPSPLPSPDYDAPSPQGEADLKLPEEDEPGTPGLYLNFICTVVALLLLC